MKSPNPFKPGYHRSGFSIIELLIVMAIMGIIAAVAIPSYQSYLTKGRRADAQIALTKGAAKLEKYFYENNGYSSNASLIWPNSKSSQGYYNMSVALDVAGCGGSPCFILTATAIGIQSDDTECATLTLDSQEDKGSTGGGECWS